MERSIKIFLIVSWIFILAVYTCQSKKDNQTTATMFSTSLNAETFFDTLFYYDDSFIAAVNSIEINDRFGVWFSPKRDTQRTNCSLVGIQYLFGDTMPPPVDTVMGFVDRVSLYPNDTLPLMISDTNLVTFKFLPRPKGQVTTIYLNQIGKSLAVEDSIDFLIGWITADSSLFPIGLRDSMANYTPARSYKWQPGDSIPQPLPFDLGVRAIFECEKPLPDSGNLTFELRWNKKNTDLDLYLILPIAKDTIWWDKKKSKFGIANGRLDVDDNDGYGPEKIVHLYNSTFQDTSAQLYVNYYGPVKGRASKASVLVRRNSTIPVASLSRRLKSLNWWHVANIDLTKGNFLSVDTVYITPPDSNLSLQRKH